MNAEDLFWDIAAEMQTTDPRIVEGHLMRCRCLRLGTEFLALVDYKGSGLVVKLSKGRVENLISMGIGRSFAPAGKIFGQWVSVPELDRGVWTALLWEGVEFVGGGAMAGAVAR